MASYDGTPHYFENEWKPWMDCPPGTFIDGIQVSHHPMAGVDGVRFNCATRDGHETNRLVKRLQKLSNQKICKYNCLIWMWNEQE